MWLSAPNTYPAYVWIAVPYIWMRDNRRSTGNSDDPSSRRSLLLSLCQHLQNWSKACWMLIANWATIIISMMNLLSTLGPLVCHHRLCVYHVLTAFSVLDPRISYTKGLKRDYKNNLDLDTYLESSKQLLQDYFDWHYPPMTSDQLNTPLSSPGPSRSRQIDGSPQKVDFTSCYDDEEDAVVTEDELECYFSLPKENFRTTMMSLDFCGNGNTQNSDRA